MQYGRSPSSHSCITTWLQDEDMTQSNHLCASSFNKYFSACDAKQQQPELAVRYISRLVDLKVGHIVP